MESEIFDLALIDPPYTDYHSNHRQDKSSKLSKGIIQQTKEEQVAVIRESIRCLKNDCAFFVFTNWENIHWIQKPFQSFFRNMIIWDKGNWTAGDLNGSFGNKYEVVFLGVKGKDWSYRGGRDNDIWSIARPGTNRVHPTEKSVELYTKCIQIATDPGAYILDPYCGSGASAVAAVQLGCNFFGYELDKYYWTKIQERLDGVHT
jgi:site-specific DNA-methyltransferase (adenine-specific)